MRIVCESCSTKYSIADEKVRGKVFKIRCKKCENVIVVKGTEGGEGAKATPVPHETSTTPAPVATDSFLAAEAGAAAPAAAAAPGATAVWHVAVGNDQKGPFTAAEVKERAKRGEINGATFVWREGLGDWKPLSDVVEFADLVPATDVAREQPMFAGGSRASAELFGQADAGPASGELKVGQGVVSSDMPEGVGGQNLFSDAEQQATDEAQMTGARHDTSVLFSLSNLTSMAGGGGATAKPTAPTAPTAPAAAKAAPQRTEGSGLIDIRQMASSIPQASSASDDVAALGAFSPAVPAPVLLPVASSGPPKWIWPVAIGGGVVVLGVIGLLVFLLARKPEPVVVQAPAAPAQPGTAAAPPAEAAPPASPAAPAPAEAAAPAKAEEEKKIASATSRRRRSPSRRSTKEPSKPAAAPDPAPTESTPKKPKASGDDLDALLSGAVGGRSVGGGGGGGGESSAPEEDLPETLSRNDIRKGMSAILPSVQQCNARFRVPGTVSMNITIARTGRIQKANVSSPKFAGTPTGNCVQTAVRRAKFPKFSGAPVTITYPFVMR